MPRVGASIRLCGGLLVLIAVVTGASAAYSWQSARIAASDAETAVLCRVAEFLASGQSSSPAPASAPASSPARLTVQPLAFLAFDGRDVILGIDRPTPKVLRTLFPVSTMKAAGTAVHIVPDPITPHRSFVAVRGAAGTPPADGVIVLAVTGAPTRAGAAARLAGLTVAMLGVFAAAWWLRRMVLRPVETLVRAVSPTEANLPSFDAAPPPPELAEFSRFVAETRADLHHWKNEARALRRTLDDRVTTRTQDVERELRQKAREAATDPLSGLANRRALESSLSQLIARAREARTDLVAVLIDVNGFKFVNDVLGHDAGDRLIQVTGGLLRATLRPGFDTAFRLGGDEFVVLMLNTSAAEAAAIAERSAAMFAQLAHEFDSAGRRPSLSAGVASMLLAGVASSRELLKAADHAMYTAKRTGHPVAVSPARVQSPSAQKNAGRRLAPPAGLKSDDSLS